MSISSNSQEPKLSDLAWTKIAKAGGIPHQSTRTREEIDRVIRSQRAIADVESDDTKLLREDISASIRRLGKLKAEVQRFAGLNVFQVGDSVAMLEALEQKLTASIEYLMDEENFGRSRPPLFENFFLPLLLVRARVTRIMPPVNQSQRREFEEFLRLCTAEVYGTGYPERKFNRAVTYTLSEFDDFARHDPDWRDMVFKPEKFEKMSSET